MPKVSAVAIADQSRITVPRELWDEVEFLREAQNNFECSMQWLGDAPGFVIQSGEQVALAELELPAMQRARIEACRWPIKFEVRNRRFTLPKSVRALNMLPDHDDAEPLVVLLATEDRLEVWRPQHWYDNLLRVASASSIAFR